MRPRDSFRVLGSVVLALVVAGCGSSPTVTAAPTPAPSPVATPAVTAAPVASTAPVASSDPGSSGPASSSNGHDAPDLENLLPASFQSVTLERDSLVGSNAVGSDPSSVVITTFLANHGRSLPDLAVAQASDPTGTVDVTFVAFRVRGADATVLMTAIVDATRAADPELAVSQVSVAGRQVTRGDSGGRIRYLYTKGDVVYGVSGASQALIDEALATLP